MEVCLSPIFSPTPHRLEAAFGILKAAVETFPFGRRGEVEFKVTVAIHRDRPEALVEASVGQREGRRAYLSRQWRERFLSYEEGEEGAIFIALESEGHLPPSTPGYHSWASWQEAFLWFRGEVEADLK
ncbi:MAG: hypothetical protein HYV42_05565 [Candidatus Magasanikbacteria bacterium]|nr:hypothetical protein [Candidatus Magasanikbacteria bacterium]